MSARKTFPASLSGALPLCLVLAVLWSNAAGAGSREPHEIERLEAECMQTHNVSAEELEAIPRDAQPDDVERKFKCFGHCILAGLDFLDDAGKLDMDKLRASGDADHELMESVLECKAANDMEDDPCEYSFGVLACSRMAMPSSEDGQSESGDE